MKITVVYTTQVKAALGVPQESIEVDAPCTVKQLVLQLAQRHGEPFRKLVLSEGDQLLPSILLCVGDQQISDGDAAELADGDAVTLLSAISGG